MPQSEKKRCTHVMQIAHSWNAIISGYFQQEFYPESSSAFPKMRQAHAFRFSSKKSLSHNFPQVMRVSKFLVTYYIMGFYFEFNEEHQLNIPHVMQKVSWEFNVAFGNLFKSAQKVFQPANLPVSRPLRVSLHSIQRQIKKHQEM